MAVRERFFVIGVFAGLCVAGVAFAQGRAPPTLEERVKTLEQEYVRGLEQQTKKECPQQEPPAPQ